MTWTSRRRAYKAKGSYNTHIRRGSFRTTLETGTDYENTYATTLPIPGTQYTASEGHPFPPPKGSLKDVGGDFYTTKSYMSSKMLVVKSLGPLVTQRPGYNANYHYYSGPICAHVPTVPVGTTTKVAMPPSFESNTNALNAKGTSAIAKCSPTNSVADAATFVGELMKDGLPSIVGSQTWSDRTLTAKNAGSEYLNVQFGWRPLVNDVQKFLHGVRHLDTVLAQYERDAGRVVRRQYNFPSVETVTETNLGPNYPFGIGNQFFDLSAGDLIRRRTVSIRQWFSGAFTYYLPSGYDSRNALSRYALMADRLGLKLTPEVLWNLAPWSWAVDWFTNTGDVLKNVGMFAGSGLVMRYGYIMEESITTDTYTLRGHKWKTGDAGYSFVGPAVPASTFVTHTKKRLKANPYGFGMTWDALSAFQLSILAALGMSRGR